MEEEYFPQPFSFLDAYHQQIKPLAGYTPVVDRSPEEMVYLNKHGI
jgi:2-oxoisovalerate dehydrogenase E1 component